MVALVCGDFEPRHDDNQHHVSSRACMRARASACAHASLSACARGCVHTFAWLCALTCPVKSDLVCRPLPKIGPLNPLCYIVVNVLRPGVGWVQLYKTDVMKATRVPMYGRRPYVSRVYTCMYKQSCLLFFFAQSLSRPTQIACLQFGAACSCLHALMRQHFLVFRLY